MKCCVPLALIFVVLTGRPAGLSGQTKAAANTDADKPKGRVSQTILELLKQDARPLPPAPADPAPIPEGEPVLKLEKITVITRRPPDLSPATAAPRMKKFLEDGTLLDWSHGTKKVLIEPYKGKVMLGFRLAF